MERESSQIKPYVYGVMIFTTVGITLANATLTRIGIENNQVALFSVAFLLAAILLSRNLLLVGIVIFGVLTLNISDSILLQYHLDRDILLAMIGAAIIVPSIYEMLGR